MSSKLGPIRRFFGAEGFTDSEVVVDGMDGVEDEAVEEDEMDGVGGCVSLRGDVIGFVATSVSVDDGCDCFVSTLGGFEDDEVDDDVIVDVVVVGVVVVGVVVGFCCIDLIFVKSVPIDDFSGGRFESGVATIESNFSTR
jgi:hypothetical protein